MTDIKTYASVPRRKPSLGLDNFRTMLEKMCSDRPKVPLYTFLDYASNEQSTIMPKDFLSAVEGVGTWLYEYGKKRKVIGILGSNSYEWLLTFYGAQYCSCIVLLLDKTASEDILKDQITRSGCQDVFYSSDLSKTVEHLAEELNLKLYPFEKINEYSKEGREMINQGKKACLDDEINSEDVAVIMYTSGTTGISKGVMLSSKNLLMNCECVKDLVDTCKDQVHILPLNHIYAILTQLLALVSGKSLHICLNMRRMTTDFQVAKPEILFLVPMIIKNLYGAVWQVIRKAGDEEKVKKMISDNKEKGNVSYEQRREMFAPYLTIFGGRLKSIISGGAPIDMQVIKGFEDFGIPIQEGYGITECSPVLAVNPDENIKQGTVGLALPGHEIMIENPNEKGIGEICAKGPSVMLGYYNMEEETAKALKNGWFHTGDLGFLDEDDYLTITGRIKNLIILSNGENISAEELEAKLYYCKAIAEVVVYEKEDKIAAMIYLDKDFITTNKIADGQEYVRNFVNEYNKTASTTKKINELSFRDEPFEKTATQKIKRILN